MKKLLAEAQLEYLQKRLNPLIIALRLSMKFSNSVLKQQNSSDCIVTSF